MKCPFIYSQQLDENEDYSRDLYECLKFDCAWYDVAGESCAVLEISRVLTAIGWTIGQLVELMRRDVLIYHCDNCRTQLNIGPLEDIVEPFGWQRQEKLDGKHVWLCDRCSEDR